MWTMIACGLSAVAGGFLIWNLDNIFCGTLRRCRRDIGLPWGILLEGHGWW
jgi:dihydroceramidase